MSAFFIAINRDRTSFEKEVANTMMSQLDRFGGDSAKLILGDYFAIGFQSKWRVPEEQGEQQPLKQGERWFGFYGRIDNRVELIDALALNNVEPNKSISDANLAQLYLEKLGSDKLSTIIGPFALFQFNEHSGDLLFARDGMGARH